MSGLKSVILSAVEKARTAVGDLALSVNHVSRGAATHVPGTAPVYAETLTAVSMVFTKYEAREIDNDRVHSSDWRGLVFGGTALPDFKTSDIIRVSATTGKVIAGDYRILYDDKVMAGDAVALHQLQLRRT